MKALNYPDYDKLEIRNDLPQPEIRDPREVIVRIAACGISESEIESFKTRDGHRRPPLIMGHEFCGTIEEVGTQASPWVPGQKVVSNAFVSCGACVRCDRGDSHLCGRLQVFGTHRPGAFAEYVNVPTSALFHWPDTLSAEQACLADPLANAVHVVNLIKHLVPRKILILGGGPLGLMCQQACQILLEADTVVVDPNEDRLHLANLLGAQAAFNPHEKDTVKTLLDLTVGEGMDLVIDTQVSALTAKQSLDVLRPGGAAVCVGLCENETRLKTNDIIFADKIVYGSYLAKPEEVQLALDLMVNGEVKTDSWVKSFSLDHGVQAFLRMVAGKGDDIKAVLKP